VLRYDLPSQVRKRVFLALEQSGKRQELMNFDLGSVLSELRDKLMAQYGDLYRPTYEAAIQSANPVIDHYLGCNDAMALDYIELWFKCWSYRPAAKRAVDAVNEVLREEGIGYELSPWVERITNEPATLFNRLTSGKTLETQYPEFVRKDSQFTHANIVQPCLDVLANAAFAQANKEMLDSFAKYRQADFDGALTSCGAAFESVFKTICTLKNWPYDPDKDTLSKLVDICNANGLFPPFYAEVFKSVGTVRNKLSDAHGRGPVPLHNVGQDHLEHLIHFVSAHIVFLAKLAGIT
jgi:hypothetical protein